MEVSIFKISKMDCPSEENLIRLRLNEVEGIQNLDFNLEERKLVIYHISNLNQIEEAIRSLNLGCGNLRDSCFIIKIK